MITKWVLLRLLAVYISYNALVLVTWWAGYLNDWQITIHLNNVWEGYIEGAIWHLTLLMAPWVTWQIYKLLWPKRRGI